VKGFTQHGTISPMHLQHQHPPAGIVQPGKHTQPEVIHHKHNRQCRHSNCGVSTFTGVGDGGGQGAGDGGVDGETCMHGGMPGQQQRCTQALGEMLHQRDRGFLVLNWLALLRTASTPAEGAGSGRASQGQCRQWTTGSGQGAQRRTAPHCATS
jgi:hypothetical protein